LVEDNNGLSLADAAQSIYNARSGQGALTPEGDGMRFRNLNANGQSFDFYVFIAGDKTFAIRMNPYSEELLTVGKTALPR